MDLDLVSFLKEYLKDIVYIIGAIATFLVGSRMRSISIKKEEVSIQTGELENVEAALKIYRLMLTDLQEKLKKAEEAYIVIEERLHKSMEERKHLLEENKQLKAELDEYKSNSK